MKQKQDKKKTIYQKFHWKLTLFATVVTSGILIVIAPATVPSPVLFATVVTSGILISATFLCLSFSEKELERNQYISFLNNVNTSLSHMENQEIISHQWLSRLEASYQFMIQIYDNCAPL